MELPQDLMDVAAQCTNCWSLNQIAKKLDIPKGEVQSRLQRMHDEHRELYDLLTESRRSASFRCGPTKIPKYGKVDLDAIYIPPPESGIIKSQWEFVCLYYGCGYFLRMSEIAKRLGIRVQCAYSRLYTFQKNNPDAAKMMREQRDIWEKDLRTTRYTVSVSSFEKLEEDESIMALLQ